MNSRQEYLPYCLLRLAIQVPQSPLTTIGRQTAIHFHFTSCFYAGSAIGGFWRMINGSVMQRKFLTMSLCNSVVSTIDVYFIMKNRDSWYESVRRT